MTREILVRKLGRLRVFLDDNVLVHSYEEIDYDLVAVAIERALDDLERFFEVHRGRLAREEG